MTTYSAYQDDDRPEIRKMWSEFTVEITFDPTTGSIKPWEMWATFKYPTPRRVRWGSFKTQTNAEKNLVKHLKKLGAV